MNKLDECAATMKSINFNTRAAAFMVVFAMTLTIASKAFCQTDSSGKYPKTEHQGIRPAASSELTKSFDSEIENVWLDKKEVSKSDAWSHPTSNLKKIRNRLTPSNAIRDAMFQKNEHFVPARFKLPNDSSVPRNNKVGSEQVASHTETDDKNAVSDNELSSILKRGVGLDGNHGHFDLVKQGAPASKVKSFGIRSGPQVKWDSLPERSDRFQPDSKSFNSVPREQPSDRFATNQPSWESGQEGQLFPFSNGADFSIPSEDLTWWRTSVTSPILNVGALQQVDTNGVVYAALKNSPRIQFISQDPLIRELQVIEADSEFDIVQYVKTRFQDRVDPVGDNLSITNDGSLFLQDHIWTGNAGIRRKTRTGATYDLGQQIGFRNSNSNFFNPQDQGTATLAINVTQPLLRGRGRYINQTQILIAQASSQAAWNAFLRDLQSEVEATVVAYWQLYFSRSALLQKQKNVTRGEKILSVLEGRSSLDSLPSQIARARSAVQSRKTDLANAVRDTRNAETEIKRLVADRNWKANQTVELLPVEVPNENSAQPELEQVVTTALKYRPEIEEVLKRARVASIQEDITENELLPQLSLTLGSYISALRGESEILEAIGDQFGGIKPGYSFGLEFEMPRGNRAARSRLAQRRLQVAKITSEVDEAMQNVVADSQVALRRVTSANQTITAAKEAIRAAKLDLEQNQRRWESFALIEGDLSDGQTPTTILDQLLDSQERLAAAELVYSQSILELKTAEIALQNAMGTLLMHQQVQLNRSTTDGLPGLTIDKNLQTNN
ncbi:MAG: TolC family protein [Planctomycetota bacterium]